MKLDYKIDYKIDFRQPDKYHYVGCKLHRLNGPAIEYSNGYKEWFINGKKYTKEEFNTKINQFIKKDLFVI